MVFTKGRKKNSQKKRKNPNPQKDPSIPSKGHANVVIRYDWKQLRDSPNKYKQFEQYAAQAVLRKVPKDVLLIIASNLGLGDVINMSMTCRSMYFIMLSNWVMKKFINAIPRCSKWRIRVTQFDEKICHSIYENIAVQYFDNERYYKTIILPHYRSTWSLDDDYSDGDQYESDHYSDCDPYD